MVGKGDIFPSKYLKASDLKNGPEVGKINVAALETLKGFSGAPEQKLVIYFARKLKPLVVNRTNWDAIADLYGDESDEWAGHEIELYASTTFVNGQERDTIRVRKPGAKPKKVAPPASTEMNDDIPDFGNSLKQ